MFSELPLTGKFRPYLRMNATSYYWSYIDCYTFITYAFYISYTYNCETCIASSYTDFQNSLQYTFFIFANNFFSITQLEQ